MSDKEEQERENQPWHLSNSDNSDKSKEKSPMNPPKTNSPNDQLEKEEETKPSSGSGKIESSGAEGKKDGKGGESDDHDIHIWTERERRKKMRNMFSNLHDLLPHVPSKADKSTIVDEAVNYIKTLQKTLQKLQKQKLERLQSVGTLGYGPSVINSQYLWQPYGSREAFMADQGSSSCNNLASTAIATTSNPSVPVPLYPVEFQTWTSSNVVLNICGNDAQFSVCSAKKQCLFTSICFVLEKHRIEVVSAHVSSDNNRSFYMIQAHINRDTDQFAEGFSVEESFRQAAGEIMLWLS